MGLLRLVQWNDVRHTTFLLVKDTGKSLVSNLPQIPYFNRSRYRCRAKTYLRDPGTPNKFFAHLVSKHILCSTEAL